MLLFPPIQLTVQLHFVTPLPRCTIKVNADYHNTIDNFLLKNVYCVSSPCKLEKHLIILLVFELYNPSKDLLYMHTIIIESLEKKEKNRINTRTFLLGFSK